MFYYRPPKSSIWGHRVRGMPAERASKLFGEFLAIAVGEYRLASGSFSCHPTPDNLLARFEQKLGISAREGFFHLTGEQTQLALAEIIQLQSASPTGPRPYRLLQHFAITQWRIGSQTFPTDSMFHMHYGPLPCPSTSLHFDSAEQFHQIQQTLSRLKLCTLNEKHLRLSRSREKKA